MKKISYLGLIFLLISCNSKVNSTVKETDCSNYLGYDILRIVEKPKWLPDSIDVQIMGREGYLVIKDCKGNADLLLYDENKNIILEGSFKESNIYKKRKISSKTTKEVNIPVIDGCWSFKNFTAKRPLPVSDL